MLRSRNFKTCFLFHGFIDIQVYCCYFIVPYDSTALVALGLLFVEFSISHTRTRILGRAPLEE